MSPESHVTLAATTRLVSAILSSVAARVTGKCVASHLPAPRLWSWTAFAPMLLAVLAALSWTRGDNVRASMLALFAFALTALMYLRANARGRVALVVPSLIAGAVFIIAHLVSGRPESVIVGVVAGVASMLMFVPRSHGGSIARHVDLMFDEVIASRLDASIRLDEGGARITTGTDHRYCAFAELGEPVLRRSGNQLLLLIRDPFLDPIAELIVTHYEDARALCQRLREQNDLPGGEPPIPEGLARREREPGAQRSLKLLLFSRPLER